MGTRRFLLDLWHTSPRLHIAHCPSTERDYGRVAEIRLRAAGGVGQPRECIVSFRDREGVEKIAEVAAESLIEAAGLALNQFRRAEWSRQASLETGTLRVEVCESTFYDFACAARVRFLMGRRRVIAGINSLPANNHLCQSPATRFALKLILGLRLRGCLTAARAFHRTHDSPHRRSTDT